jgi:NAD(P)-dependent dehydrogenase (short-subunit alcohol dehydrogenase family)
MLRCSTCAFFIFAGGDDGMGEAELTHYNAFKAGIVLLTKTMAIELAPLT